jgi:hypothetical protein
MKHVKLTSSFFPGIRETPWGEDWKDWPHISYSTLSDQTTSRAVMIVNPLMPVARPSQKEPPPRPPQGPWTYWQPCV